MLVFLGSYFTNLRFNEKNIKAAEKFSYEDRTHFAGQLFINQRLIASIEEAPLNDHEIEQLLLAGYHNCAKMGEQANAFGGRNRHDPFLNLAFTLQGLFGETRIVRFRPSHKWI